MSLSIGNTGEIDVIFKDIALGWKKDIIIIDVVDINSQEIIGIAKNDEYFGQVIKMQLNYFVAKSIDRQLRESKN